MEGTKRLPVKVTREFIDDLNVIFYFGIETFGFKQAEIYESEIWMHYFIRNSSPTHNTRSSQYHKNQNLKKNIIRITFVAERSRSTPSPGLKVSHSQIPPPF